VDPEIILKLIFLLFWDNIRSERELMRMLPERLDYLWFLGYSLDDEIPDHSVLSKARKRWGAEVFESLFIRSIQQCMEADLEQRIEGQAKDRESILNNQFGGFLDNRPMTPLAVLRSR